MSVLAQDPIGKSLLIKGAPDYMLQKCKMVLTRDGKVIPLTEEGRKRLQASIVRLAEQGLRTLAFCQKTDVEDLQSKGKLLEDSDNYASFESDPVLIGIVAMQDPPRP